jgi:hypothetical protein
MVAGPAPWIRLTHRLRHLKRIEPDAFPNVRCLDVGACGWVSSGLMRLWCVRSMVKILAACLMTCGLIISIPAQQRGRSKNGRQPPSIKSFTASAETVFMPCPWAPPSFTLCNANSSNSVVLTTKADARNGDRLVYIYSVSGGRIIGEGANVRWDYTGLTLGSYTLKVTAKDQRGGLSSKIINVNLAACPICDPPCTALLVSGPSEVEAGKSIIFVANVTGGEPGLTPTYKWSVSSGTIVKGQGTPAIEVNANGVAVCEVTATVKVGGLHPECENQASSTTRVRKN